MALHSYDIVGYQYRADLYCEECISELFGGEWLDSAERILNHAARIRGIERYAEETFDSGDFPKVVFRDQLDGGEHCGSCLERLAGHDDE